MTEPEQWAMELWEQAYKAVFTGSSPENQRDFHYPAVEVIQRAFEERERELREENAKLQEEIEERDEWLQVVDTTPLDEFDRLGEYWTSRFVIVRMSNAIASVFSKFAPEPIMARFRQGMRNIMQQAFVEGAIAGVRNERARQSLATRQDAPKACSEDTSHDQ